MNALKIFPAFIVTFFLLIFISSCASQRSIEDDINDMQQQSYQQWKQQRSVPTDTLADSLNVRNKEEERQPVVSGKMEMGDAVKLALLYNRNLQSAIEEKKYAHGRILQAYAGATPNISLSGTYRRPEKVNSFDINGRKVQVGFLNNYSAELSITQPIFSGGSIGAGLRAASFYKALTDKQIQAAAENVIFQTNQLYLQVLLLKQQYQVSRQQVALSDSMLQDVKTKKNFGTASDFNVLRIKVQRSNDKANMLSTKNDLEQAKAELYKTMGVSQNSKVSLKDSLQYQPEPVSEPKSVKEALLNRPDLDAQMLNVKLQNQAIQSAKSRYFPTISAFFRNQWAKPNPVVSTEDEFGRVYNVGLQLDWPIFDLSRKGKVLQEKSTLRQQKLKYLDKREEVLYEVHSAILGMNNASESIEAQKLTLQQAQEGLRLVKVGYKQGTQDQVSVLDARQSFAEAKLNYFRSLRDYELAHLKLLKATGQLRFNTDKEPGNLDSVKFHQQN